ncbi:helix-turn-helix transcriptional regulator [Paenibacillus camelliae]|uniref:helix-turn-helix transcriptional regulator n=1 Tax=Paenibacillus camelliae TaxID=512410 RepID=UPI00203EBDCD|nr:AraC family transcriptional regulator [Paenibacillus camelliae]MCM3634290.1 AraC family transcriptional regulator [Paenibacillus camelliae]
MVVAPFSSWTPSIHYAQFQTLPKGKLERRRLYDFELLYVSKGVAATEMNGHQYVLHEGDLIFLSADVYHQNEVISSTASFIGIHFDFFDEIEIMTEEDMIISDDHVLKKSIAKEAVTPPFHALSKEPLYQPSSNCVQLMKTLVQEFSKRPPGYELMCRALILQILTALLRTQITKRFEDLSPHTMQIKAIIQEIQAHPEKDWNNKLLAKRMNVHEDYMSKLFKKVTGSSPKIFIQLTRHHLARQLLSETSMSIEAISEKVGYQDAHYFSRSFRKHEGIPPVEYRKLSRVL